MININCRWHMLSTGKSANVRFRQVVQSFAPPTYPATHLTQKIQFITAMCSFSECQQCVHKYYGSVGLVPRSSVILVLGLGLGSV